MAAPAHRRHQPVGHGDERDGHEKAGQDLGKALDLGQPGDLGARLGEARLLGDVAQPGQGGLVVDPRAPPDEQPLEPVLVGRTAGAQVEAIEAGRGEQGASATGKGSSGLGNTPWPTTRNSTAAFSAVAMATVPPTSTRAAPRVSAPSATSSGAAGARPLAMAGPSPPLTGSRP